MSPVARKEHSRAVHRCLRNNVRRWCHSRSVRAQRRTSEMHVITEEKSRVPRNFRPAATYYFSSLAFATWQKCRDWIVPATTGLFHPERHSRFARTVSRRRNRLDHSVGSTEGYLGSRLMLVCPLCRAAVSITADRAFGTTH